MGGAERVIDVVLGELGELLGEILVVGFFFRVEAQVFEQQRLSFFEFQRDFFSFGPDALGTETDIFSA